jgi:hypothetical protein
MIYLLMYISFLFLCLGFIKVSGDLSYGPRR